LLAAGVSEQGDKGKAWIGTVLTRDEMKWFKLKADEKKAKTEAPFLAQKWLLEGRDCLAILDIGAYVGQISCKYAQLFPNATVYSIEPFSDSFDQLSNAAAKSNGTIRPFKVAVSDSIGRIRLNINRDRTCNSFFERPSQAGKYYSLKAEHVDQVEVDTVTLDEFCDKNGIHHIDILKIDAEGAEMKIFNGARRIFEQNKVDLVYTEVMFVKHYEGGCMYHEIASHLAQYHFSLFDIFNLKHAANGQLRYGNAIFLSEEMRKKVDAKL